MEEKRKYDRDSYQYYDKVNMEHKFIGNFLSAASCRVGMNVDDSNSLGYYWSGSLEEGVTYYAYSLNFDSKGVSEKYTLRYNGHSVRPSSSF